MVTIPSCRKTGDHDWAYGHLSEWCVKCWLVRPYERTGPMSKHNARSTRSSPNVVPKAPIGNRAAAIKRDGKVCRYCGRDVVLTADMTRPDRLTIDHIIPRMLGGTNRLDNLAVACNECNHAKGAKLPHEFVVTPKGLMSRRQMAKLTNEAQNRHQRTHTRRDGQPKRAFDRDDAFDTAAFLAERDDRAMEAFECDECGMWHVRICPGLAKLLAKQRDRWFDPALFAELGPRVAGQLKGENRGPRRCRRQMIATHFKGAERKAKHYRERISA